MEINSTGTWRQNLAYESSPPLLIVTLFLRRRGAQLRSIFCSPILVLRAPKYVLSPHLPPIYFTFLTGWLHRLCCLVLATSTLIRRAGAKLLSEMRQNPPNEPCLPHALYSHPNSHPYSPLRVPVPPFALDMPPDDPPISLMLLLVRCENESSRQVAFQRRSRRRCWGRKPVQMSLGRHLLRWYDIKAYRAGTVKNCKERKL